MSLPIHIGQMERGGEGRVCAVEVSTDYERGGEMKGTITLQFWGNIFAESSPASNYLGIPLPGPAPLLSPLLSPMAQTTPPPAPLAALFKPFQRRISA